MKTQELKYAFFKHLKPGARTFLLGLVLSSLGIAQTNKLLFNYFKPTPIVSSPLTSNIWGASGVIPRDKCNGLQDQTGTQTTAPKWLYWDGKILRAKDGKYHMFASRWPQSSGHNGGWGNSDIIHAVSDSSPIGPYVDKGFAYTYNFPNNSYGYNGDTHHGHNVSALELPDGTYCLFVSEVVPFSVFTSASLDGPWTYLGHAKIDGSTVKNPGDPGGWGGSQQWESNVSMVVRTDGNYEIVQRHGLIAISTTGLLGPYKMQQPTYKYPANQIPSNNFASIYPVRPKHSTDDPTAPGGIEAYNLIEDPLIWYSGGQYHVVYNYCDDRVGYHLTSPDGIHDWTDQGFAFDPRQAKQLFSYTDGTVSKWYKMERPNIYMENGHIKFFTFAVTDVDKGQISGGSNHANNVIVMAFDGETFDKETGITGVIDRGIGGASHNSLGGLNVNQGNCKLYNLSGKAIGPKSLTTSGIYLMQKANAGKVQKVFINRKL